jgi:hypothetical protein
VKRFFKCLDVIGRTGKQLGGPQNFNIVCFYKTYFILFFSSLEQK